MPVAESVFITGSIQQVVPTRAAAHETESRQQQWQRIIDNKFIEWAVHPEQFDDDDGAPPSRETIHLAATLAKQLINEDVEAPTRVVVDANGGIVFEIHEGDIYEAITVAPDLSIEYRAFVSGRLIKREPWQL